MDRSKDYQDPHLILFDLHYGEYQAQDLQRNTPKALRCSISTLLSLRKIVLTCDKYPI
jgi:hypothetical protein